MVFSLKQSLLQQIFNILVCEFSPKNFDRPNVSRWPFWAASDILGIALSFFKLPHSHKLQGKLSFIQNEVVN
jgi:hypothetical protein